ncbi:hypothetical protein CHUAL_011097 [Chamberlinius hualienensis]
MFREIVTLQVGNYSNYVGAHWWNMQGATFNYDSNETSDICHGLMFREGQTIKGLQTYLPRTICFDIKGNVEQAAVDKGIYGNESTVDETAWSGPVAVYRTNVNDGTVSSASVENPVGNEAEKRLTSPPKLWSDYVVTPFHPRSVHEFRDYSFNNEAYRFSNYFDGFDLTSAEGVMDEIDSRIRYFTEECDHLQGFHLMLDGNNGFSGVGTQLSSYLEDEFSNKCVVAVPLFDLSNENESQVRNTVLAMNSLLCINKLVLSCDLTIPLSCFKNILPSKERTMPFLNYDPNDVGESSTVLAATLDTATLMYRMKERAMDLNEFISALNFSGRKVAAMSSVLPFPVYDDRSIVETMLKMDADVQLQTLTPSCNVINSKDLSRLCVLRGFPINFNLRFDQMNHLKFPETFNRFEDFFNWYMQQMCTSKFSSLRQAETSLKLDPGYSRIFHNFVTQRGTISSEVRASSEDIDAVPVLSAVHSNQDLNSFLQELLDGANTTHFKRTYKNLFSNFEEDEYTNMLETTRQLAECYSNAEHAL